MSLKNTCGIKLLSSKSPWSSIVGQMALTIKALMNLYLHIKRALKPVFMLEKAVKKTRGRRTASWRKTLI